MIQGPNHDLSEELQQQIKRAVAARTSLQICAGLSKSFLGNRAIGEPISTAEHRGIVSYDPAELVITARSGTPLADVESALAERGQKLSFEPPHFGDRATLGGTIACGLSGPARPFAGAARDQVLGVKLINGRGELLKFGGQVMKNVAGYDVSRLMCGAMGTLGLLLEVSLKVVPAAGAEITLRREMSAEGALQQMLQSAALPLPLTAACYDGSAVYLRLSSTNDAVAAAAKKLVGYAVVDSGLFWQQLREQRLAFFNDSRPLWRLSVPVSSAILTLPGDQLIDWGGAQRWLKSDADAGDIRRAVDAIGGHATLFRAGQKSCPAFHPLAPELLALHRKLKQAFDPHGLFNPGRLHADLKVR